jgi:hypothetical protein
MIHRIIFYSLEKAFQCEEIKTDESMKGSRKERKAT